MPSIWQSHWQLGWQLALRAPNHGKSYDEERLNWESASCGARPKRLLRLPKLRRATGCLLLIDFALIGLLLHSLEPLITLLRRNEDLFGSRINLSRNDTQEVEHRPDHHHAGQDKIPRILHQTCPNETIPAEWVYPQGSCKEAYIGFEYRLWTDELARDFLSREYSWFLDTWDNYVFPIQRADSIRYFVLHHFGGIYLDMDTVCNERFPIDRIESDRGMHHALFKSTLPTGVTNDFMIASARHPAYTGAIYKLPVFHAMTRPWARLEPYCAIMMSSGPLFLTLALKDYLLEQSSLPSSTVHIIDPSGLAPYITDLESSTWHRGDSQALIWLGERPWIWFSLGAIGLAVGIYVSNRVLLIVGKAFRRSLSFSYSKIFVG